VLALIARGARGSFRDAISILDQLAAATENRISVQDVLQLAGAVDEESLFRLCDTIVDHDTAGALTHVEELAEQGQDIGRLVADLTEHLRSLLLVQHLGYVPESLPLTEEAREKLRGQANQLPEPMVVRLLDLLHVAIDDQRQGGDPRLPLELALVKVTRPHNDLSRDSLVHRVEMLEGRLHAGPAVVTRAPSPVPASAVGPAPEATSTSASAPAPEAAPSRKEPPTAPSSVGGALDLGQLQEAWTRSVLPALQEKSIPVAMLLGEARPKALDGDVLTLEFAPEADFHRTQMDEQRNVDVVREVLYEVTGHRLAIATEVAERHAQTGIGDDGALTEESWLSLLKDTFDATEVEGTP
jgi:DNA polymerase-3 subunit gamma/tau